MKIEDVLRDTLADMAHEEPPPPAERFLRAAAPNPGPRGMRPAARTPRGMALAAAAAVVVLATGTVVGVQGLSGERPAPAVPTGPATRPSGDVAASAEREPGGAVVVMKDGLRLADVLPKLAKASGRPLEEFERAARKGAALGLPAYANGSLEGFAFPGTYRISPGSSAEEVLASMVTRFNRTADDVHLEDAARRAGRTPREIMITASIVQAEASRAADMPKIARVIYNRLDHRPPMKLHVDSPLLYALGKYGVHATTDQLRSPSRYNTYRFPGLPPGPIGNPGRDAVEAALHPATGSWLYYVAVDPATGETRFLGSDAEYRRLLDDLVRKRNGAS
ncbi:MULTISPECIES: endolytic transglycosylase MltG [unclassified Nonomuraea]|uniref:endolytic transglycosylase MltG n=1 Tax=unclassified Nonomuraea TaxID=2593643 RepID=UPI0033F6C024